MSIIERLKKLYKHNCCNCEHLDVLPDEPESTRYDCFCPNFNWRSDPQYFWEPYKENDCKHFTYKKN